MSEALAPVCTARHVLSAIAPLFEYPNGAYDDHLATARLTASEADRHASVALEKFASATAGLDRGALESIYTTTFDLGASCLPYLGAHLFEAESRDRARLMVGLRMTYRTFGYEADQELPDHIAEVLRFSDRYESGEWRDLLRLVLSPALTKMTQALAPSKNPYRHLIEAVSHLCNAALVEESDS